MRTPEQGADTIVYLAADPAPAASNGLFWHDRRPRPVHRTRASHQDASLPIDLWESLTEIAGSFSTQEIS